MRLKKLKMLERKSHKNPNQRSTKMTKTYPRVPNFSFLCVFLLIRDLSSSLSDFLSFCHFFTVIRASDSINNILTLYLLSYYNFHCSVCQHMLPFKNQIRQIEVSNSRHYNFEIICQKIRQIECRSALLG